MKEEIILKDNLKLIEKELETITERLTKLEREMEALDELKKEIKAIKLYLSKRYPEFKKEYLDIIKKFKDL